MTIINIFIICLSFEAGLTAQYMLWWWVALVSGVSTCLVLHTMWTVVLLEVIQPAIDLPLIWWKLPISVWVLPTHLMRLWGMASGYGSLTHDHPLILQPLMRSTMHCLSWLLDLFCWWMSALPELPGIRVIAWLCCQSQEGPGLCSLSLTQDCQSLLKDVLTVGPDMPCWFSHPCYILLPLVEYPGL